MLKYILTAGLLLTASVAAASWPQQSYQTESFEIPSFHVSRNSSTSAGDLFLSIISPIPGSTKGPFIAQDNGELIWHGPSAQIAFYNFQSQIINNKPTLTYWDGFLDRSGHGYGQVQVLNNDYTMNRTICLPPSVTIVPPRPNDYPGRRPNPCYVDKHESIVTNRNSIIVTAYNATQTDLTAVSGPRDGWVFDCLFFELSLVDNSILFQWSALDHVPITKSNFVNRTNPKKPNLKFNGQTFGLSRSAPWDYFHINSVEMVPGGYIVNSRMTWSLYHVRGQDGSLKWTLEGSNGGDFKLLDPIFFSWQHHPRLQHISPDHKHLKVHLFNNDGIPGLPGAGNHNVSCGYYLNIDTNTMTVSQLDRYHNPANRILAVAEGSVQTLPNGHHLVGYGHRPYVEEYDGNGDLAYTMQFAYDVERTHSYRAYRETWSATPTYMPLVVARLGASNKVLTYMSWNGATTYKSWNVYAGATSDPNTMTRINTASSVPKKGFETAYSFAQGTYKYVRVEALSKSMAHLANSSVVAIS